jgi:hypothetical protein
MFRIEQSEAVGRLRLLGCHFANARQFFADQIQVTLFNSLFIPL